MISASDRKNAVLLINEAITSGASCKKACERLGITERKRQIIMRLDTRLLQPFTSWSNSL